MFNRMARLVLLLLVLPLALSCNAGKSGKIKIAFVTNNASDYWTIARKGVEKAGAELKDTVEIEYKMPGEGTAAEQQRIVDDLLANGTQGIAISPTNPDNQTQMLNNAAKQAVVITQDSDAPNSERACYIGTDNVEAGKKAGDLLKELLPEGGKIMVFVGMADARNAQERYQGLKQALAGSKIEIIDLRTDDTDRVRAKRNPADTLVKYPDIAAMVGLWSYNGPAILNAITEAGKVGQVKIVCFDEEDETLAGVKSGAIYATVVQQPFEFGYRSIITLAKVIGGDKSMIPANKQIFVPTIVIKKDGVDEFKTKLDQIRGRK
jgi:ribose transport system substrate-binding protein